MQSNESRIRKLNVTCGLTLSFPGMTFMVNIVYSELSAFLQHSVKPMRLSETGSRISKETSESELEFGIPKELEVIKETMSENRELKKSIYLVGPHSTGKTTLTTALQEFYGPGIHVLSETARKVLKEKNYTASTIFSNQCFQMQRDIFDAQFQAERNLLDQNKIFISDRNAIDPIMYTKKYSTDPNDWKRLCNTWKWKILSESYKNREKCVVILLEPKESFLVNDGTRMMPEDLGEWIHFGQAFVEFLEDQTIPFYVLGENCSDIKDRVRQVYEWVNM